MTYSYEDKVSILTAWQCVSPEFMSGAGAVYYGRLLSVIGGSDEFECSVPLSASQYICDEFLEVIVNELDVFYGNNGLDDYELLGCDEGVGAFKIEGFYPSLPIGLDNAADELVLSCDADFTAEEFVSSFEDRNGRTQEEVDFLVTKPNGVFDALIAFGNGEYGFENEFFEDEDKKALVGMWLDGVIASAEDEAGYGESGLGCQYGIAVRNRDLDAWLRFVPRNFASEKDVMEGAELFSSLIGSFEKHFTYWCSDLCISSFRVGDMAFEKGDNLGRSFEIHSILCRDALETGYAATEFSVCRQLPPEILLPLLKVKNFLERMDKKYHYLKGEGKNGK